MELLNHLPPSLPHSPALRERPRVLTPPPPRMHVAARVSEHAYPPPPPYYGFCFIPLTGNPNFHHVPLSKGCRRPGRSPMSPSERIPYCPFWLVREQPHVRVLHRCYWRLCSLASDRNTKQTHQPAKSHIIFHHLAIIHCCEHECTRARAHLHTCACNLIMQHQTGLYNRYPLIFVHLSVGSN